MRAASTVLMSLVVLVTPIACDRPATGSGGDQQALEIVYLANEGFLVSTAGHKVFIDGLFRDGVSGYAAPPQEWRDAVELGESPFDAVDLVLATHYHADHFDAHAVCRFLAANPLAEFVSTQQALDQMRSACDDPADFEGRVHAGLTAERDPVPFTLGDLRLEPVFLHHGAQNPVENIAFVIEIGGWSILHMGDSEATVEEVRAAGLGDRSIDLAFVPYWYLLDRDWRPAVTEVIRPGGVVAMHVPPPGSPHLSQDWEDLAASIQGNFENAMLFKEPFDTRTVRAASTVPAP
jgi:L-ascorbate metabolism protein UlaG (beta-lactamase superfamily)